MSILIFFSRETQREKEIIEIIIGREDHFLEVIIFNNCFKDAKICPRGTTWQYINLAKLFRLQISKF